MHKLFTLSLSTLLLFSCTKTREDQRNHELDYKNQELSGEILGKEFIVIDSKVDRIVKGVNPITHIKSDSSYEFKFYEENINCIGEVEENAFTIETKRIDLGGYYLENNTMEAYFEAKGRNRQYDINQGSIYIQEIIGDTLKGLIDIYYNKHNHLNGRFVSYFCDERAICEVNGEEYYMNFPKNQLIYNYERSLEPKFGYLSNDTLIIQATDICEIDEDSSYIQFIMPNNYDEDVYCIGSLGSPILHLNMGKYDTTKAVDTTYLRDSARYEYIYDTINSIQDSIELYDTIIYRDTFEFDTTILVPIQRTRYKTKTIENGGFKITLIDSDIIEGNIEFHHNDQVISGGITIKKCN